MYFFWTVTYLASLFFVSVYKIFKTFSILPLIVYFRVLDPMNEEARRLRWFQLERERRIQARQLITPSP